MKIYLASGWFSCEQERARQDMIFALSDHEVFSPKDMNLGEEGMDMKKVFEINLAEIMKCDLIVVSTIGKDMGTLFEAGVACALDIPIVYYAPGLEGPFNLMLAESARGVKTTRPGLHAYAQLGFPEEKYMGVVE